MYISKKKKKGTPAARWITDGKNVMNIETVHILSDFFEEDDQHIFVVLFLKFHSLPTRFTRTVCVFLHVCFYKRMDATAGQ